MSDSEELSSEAAAGFEEILRISGILQDGNHLEELKWLKKCLEDELAIRKTVDEDLFEEVCLHPTNDSVTAAIEQTVIKRLLKFFRLDPPTDSNQFWKIPTTIDEDDLEQSTNDLQILIFTQLNRCKSCKTRYKNILKHLKKSENCLQKYSEEEHNELLLMAKTKKKEKEKQYQKKNKNAIASRMAKRYKNHKDEILQRYQDNKLESSRKFLDYERKNSYKISVRKANYYEENKQAIAKKRHESKSNKPAFDVSSTDDDNPKYSQNDKTEYTFKRKAIDFTMADLEQDAEEDDEEYQAFVKDVGKKSLPSRHCKNMLV